MKTRTVPSGGPRDLKNLGNIKHSSSSDKKYVICFADDMLTVLLFAYTFEQLY